ncbi:MAG: M60 family metallopeptidase [Kiritimatiellia bacterium]
MKKASLFLCLALMPWLLVAQVSFRNVSEPKFDSKGRAVETLDYDRKIVATNGLPTAAEYRAELAERERMKKVAKACGPWFESIQLLEVEQKKGEDAKGDGSVGLSDNVKQTGGGILAYVEAMRVFNSNTSEGGSVSKDAKQLKATLDELLYRRGGEVICGPSRGVSIKYPLELLLVRYQSWKAQSLPMDELYPAKSADLWPGKVPAEAERVTKKITLYPGEGGYLSTGLYVPPGEIVTIKCGSLSGNLTAQIGCHTDALEPQIMALDDDGQPDKEIPINLMKVKMGWQQITDNRPLWRWPNMVRRFSITKKRQEIGHVLGGILWLTWSGGQRPMELEISGCVQMPWFRLGLDTNEDWEKTISKYQAPWGELQCKNIIFTVEAKHMLKVKNMVALAQWWGKAAAIMHRVSGRSLPTDTEANNYRAAKREWGIVNRKLVQLNLDAPPDNEELVRAATEVKKEGQAAAVAANRYGTTIEQENVPTDPRAPKAMLVASREKEPKWTAIRVVDDTQISIGAGHSGYPIMCILWGGRMMHLPTLQRVGSWGALHEIGHNMGQGENGIFALPGNIEVVNNFFGTCVMNLLNKTRFTRIMDDQWNDIASKAAKNTPDLWKVAGGNRLVFYMTLAHYFGVESVVKIAMDRGDKYPTAAIADRICCAWSKAVQRDLTPYFEIWGLPISKATYTYTQDWKPWPTEAEKAGLFNGGNTMDYRGIPFDEGGESMRFSACPEEPIKTRRQLRAQEHFKKTVKED